MRFSAIPSFDSAMEVDVGVVDSDLDGDEADREVDHEVHMYKDDNDDDHSDMS
jgi:hypothetical protein